MVRIAWREDRRTILVVGTFLALAFFMLPTRVHERYMFPVFAILPILAVIYRRWILVTVLLSVAAFINLHGVLTTPLYATPNIKDLPLGEFFREPVAIVFSIILSTVAFVLVVLELRPSRAVAAQAEEAALVSDSQVERAADGAAIPAGAAVALAASAGGPGSRLRDDVRRFFAPVVSLVPIRRDRSGELNNEGAASSTGLDLLLLVVVFVAAMGLRTFRLEQPFGMHFDEVYHARTATEFLQFWRYGIPHSIYEYTHPHMAKYLIAPGIRPLATTRSSARTSWACRSRTAAIEPR